MSVTHADQALEVITDQFEIVARQQGTTTTIAVVGECDLAWQTVTRGTIRSVLARSPECVVLDLSELTFIDTSGVHAILELQERSTELDVHLVIVPGPPAVQQIFDILKLAAVLPFVAS